MNAGATKIIELVIAPDGSAKIETRGFAGPECRHASQALEEALGVRQSEKLTAEFYSQASQSQHIRQEGN